MGSFQIFRAETLKLHAQISLKSFNDDSRIISFEIIEDSFFVCSENAIYFFKGKSLLNRQLFSDIGERVVDCYLKSRSNITLLILNKEKSHVNIKRYQFTDKNEATLVEAISKAIEYKPNKTIYITSNDSIIYKDDFSVEYITSSGKRENLAPLARIKKLYINKKSSSIILLDDSCRLSIQTTDEKPSKNEIILEHRCEVYTSNTSNSLIVIENDTQISRINLHDFSESAIADRAKVLIADAHKCNSALRVFFSKDESSVAYRCKDLWGYQSKKVSWSKKILFRNIIFSRIISKSQEANKTKAESVRNNVFNFSYIIHKLLKLKNELLEGLTNKRVKSQSDDATSYLLVQDENNLLILDIHDGSIIKQL
jgi:hypothetical protein